MEFRFDAIGEDLPDQKWRGIYRRHWAAYRGWFLKEGNRARPNLTDSRQAIRRHMPELLPAYERFVECAGGGDLEARFLSMWRPPAYIGGCSQLILPGAHPRLIRNYDYSPRLLEGTWLATRLNGKRVIGLSDCLWGLLDGINEDGLAMSLAFGGRRAVGKGFGIPIVLRYVLEFASDTREAVRILSRVPVHMSYTVAIVDRRGRHATMFLNPGKKAERSSRTVSTNHQRRILWPRHARATRSRDREYALRRAAGKIGKGGSWEQCFFQPPVFQSAYDHGFGTLYTAHYNPGDASASLCWPGERWTQSCADFRDASRIVHFGAGRSPSVFRPIEREAP